MKMTCDGQQRTITLDKTVGRGGEAIVYSVGGDPSIVAKVYRTPSTEQEHKLRDMIAQPPVDPSRDQGHVSIAWPQDVFVDDKGHFSGYIMPAITGGHSFAVVYHPGDRRRKLPASFDYRYLLRTAHNLSVAIAAIHHIGYIIGDLNDCNILVQPDARVTVIDCDSFQVGRHRCPVGRPEYTAPELQGVALGTVQRSVEQDNFALAVLIYRLLMKGYHPYAGVGDPSELGERIRAGLCPHAPNGPRPQCGAPPLDQLFPGIRDLFVQTFVQGQTAPVARANATVWSKLLMGAEKSLVKCRKNSSHYYFGHLSHCPECRHRVAQRARARVGQPPPAAATPFQRPLPTVRRISPSMKVAVLLLVIAVAFMLRLAEDWGRRNGYFSQAGYLTQAPSAWTERMLGQDGYIDSPKIKPLDTLESGSEIYRRYFAEDP